MNGTTWPIHVWRSSSLLLPLSPYACSPPPRLRLAVRPHSAPRPAPVSVRDPVALLLGIPVGGSFPSRGLHSRHDLADPGLAQLVGAHALEAGLERDAVAPAVAGETASATGSSASTASRA